MVWEQTQSIYHNVGSFSEIKLFQELTFFGIAFAQFDKIVQKTNISISNTITKILKMAFKEKLVMDIIYLLL